MLVFKREQIDKVSSILNNNGIVAFPTETVYGLGVKIDSLENYEKLVKVKERSPDKPFTIMFSNFKQIEKYIADDELVKEIISKCMPGPLTIIVKAKIGVSKYLDHGTGFIGLRMPDDYFVLDLIDRVGVPLFVPSCNKANQPPCNNVDEIISVFGKEIDCVVEGNCEGGVPSTIIKIDNEELILIRQGKISLNEIKEKIK